MNEVKRSAAGVEVSGLSYLYPGSREAALTDVQFSIAAGQRVGLLGPNGAGKSTLMRLLCGYLPAQTRRGKTTLRVAGMDVCEQPLQVRKCVGYLPEHVPLYFEFRVEEHLNFRAAIKGIARAKRLAEIRRVAELVGVTSMLSTPISRLSRGYKQRVGIADALLGSPPLVILDEPTVGLDPNQVHGIRDALRDLGGGQTLIFSSHMLMDVESLCDRIVILSQGKIVADDSVNRTRPESLVVEWDGEVKLAAAKVMKKAWASIGDSSALDEEIVEEEGNTSLVLQDPPSSLAAAIGRSSLEQGIAIVRLETGRARLEERFARATGFARKQVP